MSRFGWPAGPHSASMKSCAKPARAGLFTCSTTALPTPTDPFTWATLSTRASRTSWSNPRPWPGTTPPTSPATTAMGCPSRSRSTRNWAIKSSPCRYRRCWRLAAPTRRSMSTCKRSSLSALAASGAGKRSTKPWRALTRPGLWKGSMAFSKRASSTAA